MRMVDEAARFAPLVSRQPEVRVTTVVVRIYWNPGDSDIPDSWDWAGFFHGQGAEGEMIACSDHAPWAGDLARHYPWGEQE